MPDLAQQRFIHTQPAIAEGLAFLRANDPVFSKAKIDDQAFNWPFHGGGFLGLARIVLGQQVSTGAARAMWARLQAAADPLTHESFMTLDDDALRSIGYSRQKMAYTRGLAEAVKLGRLDLGRLERENDAAITEGITALKGFGPWSAQMYLIFCLARPDVWPSGDLGIQSGLQIYLRRKERPDSVQTEKHGKRFAPYRTAAALLLWNLKDS